MSRYLSSEELASEMSHRLRLRGVVANRALIDLVAEMIEIARHHVAEGYSQCDPTDPTASLPRGTRRAR